MPNYYTKLILNLHLLDIDKAEKIILHIFEFLKNFPPRNINQMQVDREGNPASDEQEEKQKKFETKFKVLLLENIKNII